MSPKAWTRASSVCAQLSRSHRRCRFIRPFDGGLSGVPAAKLHLLPEFDVPVSEVDEVLPALVVLVPKGEVGKRAPLGSLRLADQLHVSFVRRAVALLRVTLDAG